MKLLFEIKRTVCSLPLHAKLQSKEMLLTYSLNSVVLDNIN